MSDDAKWRRAYYGLVEATGLNLYPRWVWANAEVGFGLMYGAAWEHYRDALGPDPLHSKVCAAKAEFRALIKTILDENGLDGTNYGRCPNCGAT